jgi:hypothetical protein
MKKESVRLYLSFICVALASTLISLLTTASYARKGLLKATGEKGLAIASTIASQIEPSQISAIRDSSALSSPEYKKILCLLQAVLCHQKNLHSGVRYLYTLTPSSQKGGLIYGVDASYGTSDFSPPGTPYTEEELDDLLSHPLKPFFSREPVVDGTTTYLSAFYPLCDEKGNYLATLGFDFKIDSLLTYDRHLYERGALALLLSLSIGLIFAYFLLKESSL